MVDGDPPARPGRKPIRVLAVASGGGHWEQMMLLRPALERFEVTFATTDPGLAEREGLPHVLKLDDTNRDQPLKAVKCALQAVRAVLRVRPAFVVTTGALPGLICLMAGAMIGAKTIWIDSVANSETPSLSGKVARPFVSLWLTQWRHLARDDREYGGSLL